MAPKVQVPMDFGVKYLGSPSHGNLKFRLQEGGEIPANSMIISYNSPVIESLTTDLLQTSIDVDDFSKDAVQCFVESCYSGDLRKITKTNFRDANKISTVFEVSWLVKRCCEFFKRLVDELDRENFEDQHYLFEEAMFMWVTLKNKNFIEIVIKKFSSEIVKCDQFFVPRYLADLSSRTARELNLIIEVIGENKHVLVEILIDYFGKNPASIDANSRHLLENVNYALCYSNHKSLFKKLFEQLAAIESPSKDDFGLMLRLFNQSTKSLSNCLNRVQYIPKYMTIPKCRILEFSLIRDYPDLMQLMEFLETSPLVENSYIFFDAVYCWVFDEYEGGKTTIDVDAAFVKKFIGIMTKRGWKPLVPEYLRGKDISCLKELVAKLQEIPEFISYKNYCRILSVDNYSPEEFFGQENHVKFFLKHTDSDKCQDEEKCGFILRLAPLVGNGNEDEDENSVDAIDMKIVLDPELYPSDIELHDQCFNMANMHVALEIDKFKYQDYPISWSGKLSRDGSNKYFVWGQHRFFSKKEGTRPAKDDHKYVWFYGSDAGLRLVVYHFG